jgi:uncharacterized membrane protein
MDILPYLKVWLIASVVFVALDMTWLGLVMGKAYSEKLGYLGTLKGGKLQFNLPVGLLTQLIIITGLVAILLRLSPHSLPDSLLWGGIVSFVIYATYDLTSLSFVKNWPLDITVIDIIWGTAQGVVAGLVVWLAGPK